MRARIAFVLFRTPYGYRDVNRRIEPIVRVSHSQANWRCSTTETGTADASSNAERLAHRCRQANDYALEYSSQHLAPEASIRLDQTVARPAWIERLDAFDPARVVSVTTERFRSRADHEG
jgi:hypothetical protein